MYNRYIPQPDGSYSRSSVKEPQRPRPHNPPPPPPCEHREPPDPHPPHRPPQSNWGISGFLRNLLPKEFDTGDLIIVLLLLLMAGDCEESRNNALLTLALYFFM